MPAPPQYPVGQYQRADVVGHTGEQVTHPDSDTANDRDDPGTSAGDIKTSNRHQSGVKDQYDGVR
jgi:hypothetical protein